jgi:hypothetical protein
LWISLKSATLPGIVRCVPTTSTTEKTSMGGLRV